MRAMLRRPGAVLRRLGAVRRPLGRGAAPAQAGCPARVGARYWRTAYYWDLAWLTAVMMDCALPWPAKKFAMAASRACPTLVGKAMSK